MQKKLEGTMENYFGLIYSNDGPLITYPSLEGISLLWYTLSIMATPCNFFGRYSIGRHQLLLESSYGVCITNTHMETYFLHAEI